MMRPACVHPARCLSAVLAAAALVSVGACTTDEGGPTYYTGSYQYTEVELPAGLLSPGETGQARLIAYDHPAIRLGELEAIWSGDNDAVATVDSSGLITAHAEGLTVLSTDVDPNPSRWALYVSPASACGSALDVGQWGVDGGFTWDGTATSGDSSITTHHVAQWALTTDAPRQVNSGGVVWRIRRPTAGSFALTRRDTLTVGTASFIDHGYAALGDTVDFSGEVYLLIAGCKLSVDLYSTTQDLFAKIRPGLTDSLMETTISPSSPVATAELAVGTITGTTTRALGGTLPLMLPTDNNLAIGYAPTGYSAYVARFGGEGADSITLTQNLTPAYSVPRLARRR